MEEYERMLKKSNSKKHMEALPEMNHTSPYQSNGQLNSTHQKMLPDINIAKNQSDFGLM